MIKSLISEKEKYFWTIHSENAVTAGGYNSESQFKGKVKFILNKEYATIEIEVSNGLSLSMNLSDLKYQKDSKDFELIVDFFKDIKLYCSEKKNIQYQEINRDNLMQNLFNLLPKYKNIK